MTEIYNGIVWGPYDPAAAFGNLASNPPILSCVFYGGISSGLEIGRWGRSDELLIEETFWHPLEVDGQ